jgi:hypothetical protein
MSTNSRSEPTPASPTTPSQNTDATTDAREGSASTSHADLGHDDCRTAAATFDTACTARLPNTVDRENQYVG